MTLLWRSEFRRGWRGVCLVAFLVALVGGATLAALAGAERTSTSFDRFLTASRSQDSLVFARDVTPAKVARLRGMPGVEAIGYARALTLVGPDGRFLAAGGPLDDSMFRDVYRVRIVKGRAARPEADDEVVLGESQVAGKGIEVGDTIRLQSYTPDQIEQTFQGADAGKPAGPVVALRVVGIGRTPVDLSLQGSDGGILLVPRGVVERYGDRIGNFSGREGAVLFGRLDRGRDSVPRYLGQLRKVLGADSFDVDPTALSTGGVQESIDVAAISVLAFGVVAGLAGLVALGLVIGRHVQVAAARQLPVRDLGLTRPGRAVAAGGPIVLALVVGSLGAVLVAWLASPRFPFGVAADAEPSPGLEFDARILGFGVLTMVAALLLVISFISWRAVRVSRSALRRDRPSTIARLLQLRSAGPTVTIGVRMAVVPRTGTAAAPVRSSLFGVGLSVLGITAMVVVSASLTTLVESPRAYGRTWDVSVTDGAEEQTRRTEGISACAPVETTLRTRLQADADIEALSESCNLDVTLNGRAVGGYAFTRLAGSVVPTLLEGRTPRGRDEVALGSETLAKLHLGIGDRVTARSQSQSGRYRIVGRIVVPPVEVAQAIADGAIFTAPGLVRLDDQGETAGATGLLVRFADGVDHRNAIERIRRMPEAGTAFDPAVTFPVRPLEVERLRPIGRTPLVLAGFLALVGVIAMGHLIVTSVQQRRREFAVLKSMGFTRRQVSRSVAWQATTVAALGSVVGVVGGLIVGGLLWREVAARVGVLAIVDVPVLIVVGVVVGTFVLANLVAAIPARAAARTRPAVVLQAE